MHSLYVRNIGRINSLSVQSTTEKVPFTIISKNDSYEPDAFIFFQMFLNLDAIYGFSEDINGGRVAILLRRDRGLLKLNIVQ